MKSPARSLGLSWPAIVRSVVLRGTAGLGYLIDAADQRLRIAEVFGLNLVVLAMPFLASVRVLVRFINVRSR